MVSILADLRYGDFSLQWMLLLGPMLSDMYNGLDSIFFC